MATQWEITADGYRGEGKLSALVRKLERQAGAVPNGVSLDTLKQLRNFAVHSFERPISKKEASDLMKEFGASMEHEQASQMCP